jgi:hypothetical protein
MARFAPTIPMASLSGGDPELSISNEHWKKIESAYGYAVPKIAREQVFEATWNFLFFAEAEQVARPLSEARRRIERIKKAASAFETAIFDPQNIARDSKTYADHLVTRYLDDTRIEAPLRSVGLMASSLIIACNLALAHLENPHNQGRRKGETWEHWVCRLARIMQDHQLPTEVRKDTDKNIRGKPSPFVALIRELQPRIPEANRRPHSDIALSEAIARARRTRSGHKRPS